MGKTPTATLQPHSQDSLLNRQRRVQPAVGVTAVGLIEPQQECAALGAGLRLRREVWWWAGSIAGPAPNAPRPAPCLLDSLQHDRGGGY